MSSEFSIRTIIIDDEISAVLLLKEILKKVKGVKVCGVAHSVSEGISLILSERPEIVFLDIRLHEENGFELIRKLKEYDADPYFVMVTGFDQYGMEALKAGAFDYLLKPVDPSELLKVISRYRQKLLLQPAAVLPQKIRFNIKGGFILVNPDEILYCKADANYTEIMLSSEVKHIVSQNLGTFEKSLPSLLFFRISRSFIINLKFLAGINRTKKICILNTSTKSVQLPIAENRISVLEAALLHLSR